MSSDEIAHEGFLFRIFQFFQINHLKCPSCVNPGSPMPKFESLGEQRLRQLAIFLEASKGKQ